MRRRDFLAVAVVGVFSGAADPTPQEKLVLVELFTSQGWDLCPSAEQLLGKVSESKRVVPIAFHVDYFNDPWPDPFSDPKFSEREAQYSRIHDNENKLKNPAVLYLTPLIMVDGRVPMVGSNQDASTRAREAIRRAQAEKPGVRIDLTLEGQTADPSRTLQVALTPMITALRDRDVLVQIVPFEDRVTTNVERGELKGKTYTGRNVARGLILKETTVARSGKTSVSVEVTFPKGADPKKGGIAVIVQDNESGKVFQSAIIRWSPKAP